MSTTRLPLPLELTQPMPLTGDLGTQLPSEYDPKAQLSSNTTSTQTSASLNAQGVQVDVTADVQVDDVIA